MKDIVVRMQFDSTPPIGATFRLRGKLQARAFVHELKQITEEIEQHIGKGGKNGTG